MQTFDTTVKEIKNAFLKGNLDENLVAAASGAGIAQKLIGGGLERQCYNISNSVRYVLPFSRKNYTARVHLCQLLSCVSSIAHSLSNTSLMLEVAATSAGLTQSCAKLADCVKTGRYVKLNELSKGVI